jgi:hypothetical protein
MQEHAFGHERCFNRARGSLLVHARELDFADQWQRDGACRRNPDGRVKFRRVIFGDIEKISGADRSGHRRGSLRAR